MTLGSRGDFQPFLALALALRQAGHSVAFAAPVARSRISAIVLPRLFSPQIRKSAAACFRCGALERAEKDQVNSPSKAVNCASGCSPG